MISNLVRVFLSQAFHFGRATALKIKTSNDPYIQYGLYAIRTTTRKTSL